MTNLTFHNRLFGLIFQSWLELEFPDRIQCNQLILEGGSHINRDFAGRKFWEVDRWSSEFEYGVGFPSMDGESLVYYAGCYALAYCDYFLTACVADGSIFDEFTNTVGLSGADFSHRLFFGELPRLSELELTNNVRAILAFIANDALVNELKSKQESREAVSSIIWNVVEIPAVLEEACELMGIESKKSAE